MQRHRAHECPNDRETHLGCSQGSSAGLLEGLGEKGKGRTLALVDSIPDRNLLSMDGPVDTVWQNFVALLSSHTMTRQTRL